MKKTIFAVLIITLVLLGCSSGGGGSSGTDGGSVNPTVKWYVAKGVPSNAQGVDGDLYLDQDAAVLYVKTGGAWVTAASLRGAAGNGWLFGSGAPGASLGADGDLYLDTASTMTYRKYGGAWTSMFALQGAAGADGAAWFTGTTDPTSGAPAAAKAGDFYLNTQTTVIWKKDSSGSWSSLVVFQAAGVPQFIFTPVLDNSSVNSQSFNAVAYGNGAYVAVGTEGTIVKSADGRVWDLMAYGAPEWDMAKIAKPRTAAVKGFVDDPSPGRTIQGALRGVAYGNGKFVAVGDSYDSGYYGSYISVVTSSDGSSWGGVSIGGQLLNFTSVVFLNGVFYAVGSEEASTTCRVWSSTNGTAWTDRTSSTGLYDSMTNVAYGNGKYLVAGYNGGWEFLTSADGVSWSIDESVEFAEGVGSFYTIAGLAYGNGTFVAAGIYTTEGSRPAVFTSLNGSTWSIQDLPVPTSTATLAYNDVVYGNCFIVTGFNDTSAFIMTSPNGITWTYASWPFASAFRGAAWGPLNGGTYAVALGPGS